MVSVFVTIKLVLCIILKKIIFEMRHMISYPFRQLAANNNVLIDCRVPTHSLLSSDGRMGRKRDTSR